MSLSVRLRRVAYRVAFAILRIVWWLARPRMCGVKCVVRDEAGQVLLVRHSYGPAVWDLPGGMAHGGEPPAQTARREMDEELGLDRGDWMALGVVRGRQMHRHDTIHVFGCRLPQPSPSLTLDPIELVGSQWCDPAAPPQPIAFYARNILSELAT